MAAPFRQRLRAAWSGLTTRASAAGDLVAVHVAGNPQWTPRDYGHLANEGYAQNPIVFRCVQMQAQSVAGLRWILRRGTREIAKHAVLDLLARPNPLQSSAQFVESCVAYWRIAGNSYIEANSPRKDPKLPPVELWSLRPDRMTVVPRSDGMIQAYRYTHGGTFREWRVDPLTNQSNILHIKDFHPLHDWYGFGPIEGAARAIDLHNSAGALNVAMMQNGIVPAGVLIGKDLKDRSIEELDGIRARIAQRFGGPHNAGRPLLLPGEWDWKQLGQSMADMQWTEGQLEAARQICAAWGVPHVLIVPGESTYNNRTDARQELYENTILPLADAWTAHLNWWLVSRYGDGLALDYDRDQIPALMPRRVQHRDMVIKEWQSNLITLNEAREALQYDTVDDGEKFFSDRLLGPANGADDEDVGAPRLAASIPPRLLEHRAIDPEDIADGLDDGVMVEATRPVILDTIRHFGRRAFEQVGLPIAFDVRDVRVTEFLRRYGVERIRDLVGTTTRQVLAEAISKVVEEGPTFDGLVNAIRQTFSGASRRRARVIATTESVRASNFAVFTAGQQAGVERKQFLATRDAKTRHTHSAMDLQIQRFDEPFISPSGARGMYPGGFAQASESVNCRCNMLIIPEGEEPFKGVPELERAAVADMEWKFFEDERRIYEGQLIDAVRDGFISQELRMVARVREILSQG